jgi:hypothetical protein
MASTPKWPITTIEVMDVSLDPKNVRLRSVERFQADILAYLYEYENVLQLVSDIVKDGFFENDLPIVVKEDGRLIVLEGNRRIAALRGLANPTIVPRHTKQLTRFRCQLSQSELADLENVTVIEAPNSAAAQPILASIHTCNPKRSWPIDQQAAFYYAQLGPETSVADLQERYPAVAQNIPRFIRRAEMYDIVRKANLGTPQLKAFAESKNFSMSTFERLYASKRFREIVGLEFLDDGHVRVTGEKKDANRVLSQVVQDMSTGFLNTRRLGTQSSPEFVSYLDSIERIASPTGQPDQTAEADVPTDSGGTTEDAPSKAGTSPSSLSSSRTDSAEPKKRSTRLDAAGLEFGLNSSALARRYDELVRINGQSFPNATMDLMRTVLECALKQYFKDIGDPIPAGRGGLVTLADGLNHAWEHFKGNKELSGVIASLKTNQPRDEAQYSKSAYVLNAANHNPEVFFNYVNVLDMWDSIRPLLMTLLRGAKPSETQA